jgi:diaminopimelate decarboxylase
MTLVDVRPILRSSLAPDLWPLTAIRTDTDLWVGGVSLKKIAVDYDTPCYVFDETDIRQRCRDLHAAFGEGAVSFTAQAMSCQRVLRWIAEEGLGVNVCSAGELAAAHAAGFDGARVMLSGPKTPDDLQAALAYPVGRIIIESPSEIRRLAAYTHHTRQVLLRVSLGSGIGSASGTAVSQGAERFGLSFAHGELDKAVSALAGQPHLQLLGLDVSLGSQVTRFHRYERALQQLVDLLGHLNRWYGLHLAEINLGGGFAVAYRDGDRGFDIDAFARRCGDVLRVECDRHDVAVPRLTVTPGRAVVARAGVALYRLLEVRRDPDGHQHVAIDGGFADNPRPALYGARYTPMLIGRTAGAADQPTTIIGRYGEPGDIIARNVPLPADLRPGDLIAVADCGAYHHTMASNYGLVPRPPVIGVRDGATQLLVRPETIADLMARDVDA